MAPLAWMLLAAAPVSLEWVTPPGCPEEGAVVEEVARLLPVGAPPREPLAAKAVASLTSYGRWKVQLTVGELERTFEAASCAELADATALVLAMAIDPSLEPPAPPVMEVADAGAPDSGVADAGVADAGLAPSPVVEPERRPWQVFARAMASAVVGQLPSTAPAFGGAAGVRFERLSVEGRFGASLSQRVQLAAKPDSGADLQRLWGGARGCFAFLREVVQVGACAGADLGSLRGRSFGVTTPATGSALELDLSMGPTVAWSPLEHLSVWLELAGQLAVVRPSFTIQGLGLVHQVPLPGLNASGGLEVWW